MPFSRRCCCDACSGWCTRCFWSRWARWSRCCCCARCRSSTTSWMPNRGVRSSSSGSPASSLRPHSTYPPFWVCWLRRRRCCRSHRAPSVVFSRRCAWGWRCPSSPCLGCGHTRCSSTRPAGPRRLRARKCKLGIRCWNPAWRARCRRDGNAIWRWACRHGVAATTPPPDGTSWAPCKPIRPGRPRTSTWPMSSTCRATTGALLPATDRRSPLRRAVRMPTATWHRPTSACCTSRKRTTSSATPRTTVTMPSRSGAKHGHTTRFPSWTSTWARASCCATRTARLGPGRTTPASC
jgi:hypothetical protein